MAREAGDGHSNHDVRAAVGRDLVGVQSELGAKVQKTETLFTQQAHVIMSKGDAVCRLRGVLAGRSRLYILDVHRRSSR